MDIQLSSISNQLLSESKNFVSSQSHQYIDFIHILYISLSSPEFNICNKIIDEIIFNSKGNINDLLVDMKQEIHKIPKLSGHQKIYYNKDLANIFENSEKLLRKSFNLSNSEVENLTLDAILFLILSGIEKHRKDLSNLLLSYGITSNKIPKAIEAIEDRGEFVQSHEIEEIMEYCQDITQKAIENKIDPVIGRDDETRRVIQVLCRRTKNNPILIGDPGVGKTAIIEGLAIRIINKDVPESLYNKKILLLDLALLVAGTKYRGEFESRMKKLLRVVNDSRGKIILFIDEIHAIVGAGNDGGMDVSNLLKPALARGELHCIGATTLNEYREYIEADAALARRFQQVYISEPSTENTISILHGLKEKYEIHHGIRISNNAIMAATYLSDKYISERFLPDKAIDLIDEAASKVRMSITTKPEKIDQLERKIIQLQIQKQSLKEDKDTQSLQKIEELSSQISSNEQELANIVSIWQVEKTTIDQLRDLKTSLDSAKYQLENAQREARLDKASMLKYGTIPKIENKIQKLDKKTEKFTLLRQELTGQEIANIVSSITGIPIEKITTSENEKLLDMEDNLQNSIIGQKHAVQAVAQAIKRRRTGIGDISKPQGSFLFLGPSGVGKTELSKVLAQFLFNTKESILRIDMSEFAEKHSISKLIGSPPGYIGYKEGGLLTEAVRRRPYQVILFDEVEKAHTEIFNLFLQILDDGILTDSKGRKVNFKNTIIIMTSNLGSEFWDESDKFSKELIHANVMKEVSSFFRPEFLNRIDEIILFNNLCYEDLAQIVKIQIANLIHNDSLNIEIKLETSALDWIVKQGYNSVYGARPVQRIILQHIQNPLADRILRNEIINTRKTYITIYEENNELQFKIK